MKNTAIKIILLILSSLVLLYLGMIFNGYILEPILPLTGGVTYRVNTVQAPFYSVFIFSIVLALIPLLLFVTWEVAGIQAFKHKLISVAIVITCSLLAIIIRRQMIKLELKSSISKNNFQGNQYDISFPLDNVYFEYYALGGMITGCLIAYFIFKNKKTPL